MTTEDKKISDIYQQANPVEPPSHLDDSILAASREAVTPRAQAKSPFSGGWPISMVAVVIVAVIVVPIVVKESSQDDTAPVAATHTAAPSAKSEEIADKDNHEGKAKLRPKSESATQSTEPARSIPTMLQYNESVDRKMLGEQISQKQPADFTSPVATTNTPASSAKRGAIAAQESHEGRLQGASAIQSAGPAPSMPTMLQENESANRRLQISEEQPAALATPGIMASEDNLASADSIFSRPLKQSANETDSREKKIIDKEINIYTVLAKTIRSADEWLAHINKLITADKLKEAKSEWEAFEKAYPTHPDNKKLKAILTRHE